MKHKIFNSFSLSLLVISILAGITPANAGTITNSSASASYDENFEEFLSGSQPSDNWYSVNTAGTGSQGVMTIGPVTQNVWQLDDTNAYAAQINNIGAGVNLCTSGQIFSGSFNLDTSIANLNEWQFRVSNSAAQVTSTPANSIGVRWIGQTGADNIQAYITGSDGTPTTGSTQSMSSVSQSNYIDITISQVNCSGSASARIVLSSAAFGTVTQTLTDNSAFTAGADIDRVTGASVGTTPTAASAYIDDLTWSNAPTTPAYISSITPNSGSTAGGTDVIIRGDGFYGSPTVFLDGIGATEVMVISNSEIHATSSPQVGGSDSGVIVQLENAQNSLGSVQWTYVAPSAILDITDVTPQQGQIGANVTITVDKQNVVSPHIYFGTVEATIYEQGDLAPPNHFYRVTAPTNSPGTYDIKITSSNYADATETQTFTYVGPTFSGECPAYRPLNKENFENPPFIPGDLPARCWYDFVPTNFNAPSGTGNHVSSVRNTELSRINEPTENGTQSLRLATVQGFDSTPPPNAQFQLKNGFDACQNDVIGKWDYDVLFGAGGSYKIGMSDETVNFFNGTTSHAAFLTIQVGTPGNTVLNLKNAATTSTLTITSTPLQVGKWYHVDSNIQCETVQGENLPNYVTCTSIFDGLTASGSSFFVGGCRDIVVGSFVVTTMNKFIYQSTISNTATVYLDNLRFSYSPLIDRRIDADTGEDFLGMDLALPGDILIYRQSGTGSDIIATTNAELNEYIRDTGDNGNQIFGVLASNNEAVAWIYDCTTGSGPGKCLVIKNPEDFDSATLRSYEVGSLGLNGPGGDNEAVPDDTLEISKLAKWPLNYTNDNEDTGFGAGNADDTVLAFAFSESGTGKIGIFMEQMINNNPDRARVEKVSFAPNGETVTQICVVSFASENLGNATSGEEFDHDRVQDYLVAAHPGVGVGIWKLEDDFGASSPADRGGLQNPDITRISFNRPELLNANSLDCGTSTFMVGTEEGNVYHVNALPGQVARNGTIENRVTGDILCEYSLGGVGDVVRGVALSQGLGQDDSQLGRYATLAYTYNGDDSMNIAILDNEGCIIVGDIFAKAGLGGNVPDQFTMRMDRAHNYVYAMFDDRIIRIPILGLIGDGEYTQDPNPDDSIGCYDDNDADQIETCDDPDPTDPDADDDDIIDGDDEEVCPASRPNDPCYNGKDISDKCEGKNDPECNQIIDELIDPTDGGTIGGGIDGCCLHNPTTFIGINFAVVGEQMGIGTSGAKLLVGLFVALMFGWWFFTRSGSTVALLAGTLLGIIFVVCVGLMPFWIAFVLVLIFGFLISKIIFSPAAGDSSADA